MPLRESTPTLPRKWPRRPGSQPGPAPPRPALIPASSAPRPRARAPPPPPPPRAPRRAGLLTCGAERVGRGPPIRMLPRAAGVAGASWLGSSAGLRPLRHLALPSRGARRGPRCSRRPGERVSVGGRRKGPRGRAPCCLGHCLGGGGAGTCAPLPHRPAAPRRDRVRPRARGEGREAPRCGPGSRRSGSLELERELGASSSAERSAEGMRVPEPQRPEVSGC